ncbi:MAG: AAA family ATPase [Bacteroidaceae bacterium]|nr:AAA family ATPase [Bacteroidaceae bacterium]
MILTLNAKFEGYTPVQVLGKSTSYREVYLAKNGFEQEVVLTVYDMNKLPECFVEGKIPEFDIIPQLTNDAFPSYIECGDFNDDDTSLRWMATKYVGHTTLSEFIHSDAVRSEREMLHQFYNLLVAVKELSWRMNRGCCNNISTGNIIVAATAAGGIKFYLSGLNCVSSTCRGKAAFDACIPSRFFRAPETLVGHYNVRTDIFSLGIVLAIILQGRHPWEEFLGSDKHLSAALIIRKMCDNAPVLSLADGLKGIVAKAVATKPSERYKSIEGFGSAIAKYLGDEKLGGFDSFAPVHSKSVATPPEAVDEEESVVDAMQQQALPQPKSNVKIERVNGNGFRDVAGMKQLKDKLTRNFVDIVRNRELATQFQIAPPNGVLLYGPPGTGKTFISRKLAEESGMLFGLINPSDLGNVYIHGSQSMIADLFARSEELAAKNKCGVLLVFDEFDSLVPKRSANDDNNQANEVAEFLTRLNNCAEKNVFVVATTNRIDAIEPSIVRKGRMDEVIYVGLPDDEARKELLELELLKRPHEDIDTARIVELTKGYSSSDISYIVKECARHSFGESIKAKHLVKIDQQLLEKIIALTRPSVTADELLRYERTKERFSMEQKAIRSRIGFI